MHRKRAACWAGNPTLASKIWSSKCSIRIVNGSTCAPFPSRKSSPLLEHRSAQRITILKIVHLGKYYPPAFGGIETHTQTLARSQAALGADVRVVVANHVTADGRDVAFHPFAQTL